VGLQKFTGMPGIFAVDERDLFFEYSERSEGYILDIAYRRGDNVKLSSLHVSMGSRYRLHVNSFLFLL